MYPNNRKRGVKKLIDYCQVILGLKLVFRCFLHFLFIIFVIKISSIENFFVINTSGWYMGGEFSVIVVVVVVYIISIYIY